MLDIGRDLLGYSAHQLEPESLHHLVDCVCLVIRYMDLEPFSADHQPGAAAAAFENINQSSCIGKKGLGEHHVIMTSSDSSGIRTEDYVSDTLLVESGNKENRDSLLVDQALVSDDAGLFVAYSVQ